MCYNCGCGIPDDDMGHPNNITNQTFQSLAEKMGISTEEVKKNMKEYLDTQKSDNADFEEVFTKASQAWGQSVDLAKQETAKMLGK